MYESATATPECLRRNMFSFIGSNFWSWVPTRFGTMWKLERNGANRRCGRRKRSKKNPKKHAQKKFPKKIPKRSNKNGQTNPKRQPNCLESSCAMIQRYGLAKGDAECWNHWRRRWLRRPGAKSLGTAAADVFVPAVGPTGGVLKPKLQVEDPEAKEPSGESRPLRDNQSKGNCIWRRVKSRFYWGGACFSWAIDG